MNRKKILMFIATFLLFFAIIPNTYASCVYNITLKRPYTEEYKKKNNITEEFATTSEKNVIINLKSNEKISSVCEDAENSQGGNITCYIADSDANSSLFVVENGKLYCPQTIYLNRENKSAAYGSYYSLSATPRTDELQILSGWSSYDMIAYTLNLSSKPTGNEGKYEPSKTASGVLSPCKVGWNSEKTKIESELTAIEKELESATPMTYEQLETKVDTVASKVSSASKYCGYNDSTEIANLNSKLNVIKTKIEKKCSGSAIDGEKCKDLNSKVDAVIEVVEKEIEYQMNVGFKENIIPCESLLDEDLKLVLKFILKAVRIAVPIVLIILVTIDFSSAVMSNDQDAVKKAISKTVKRSVAALAFFFVPLIVSLMIYGLVIYNGELTIDNDSIDCSEVLE